LELVFCGALLDEPPLVSASFANLAIDESLEAVPNLIPTD